MSQACHMCRLSLPLSRRRWSGTRCIYSICIAQGNHQTAPHPWILSSMTGYRALAETAIALSVCSRGLLIGTEACRVFTAIFNQTF